MCLRLVDAEPEHIALGNPAHRRHTLIVCIEHRDRIRRLPTYDLALCLGDAFHRTEFTQMGDAHLEHYSDVRRCDLREPGDLTDVVGPHLSHQVSRAFPHLQCRQRQPDLIVERSLRCHGLALRAQQRMEQVLRGSLAHRTGDADDREGLIDGLARLEIGFGQRPQRRHRIGNHNLRDGSRLDLTLHQRRRGALPCRRIHEIMAIHMLAGNRHEQRPVYDLP